MAGNNQDHMGGIAIIPPVLHGGPGISLRGGTALLEKCETIMVEINEDALARARAVISRWLNGEDFDATELNNRIELRHCEHGILLTHNGHAVGIAHRTEHEFAFSRAGYNVPEFRSRDAAAFLEFLVTVIAVRVDVPGSG